MFEKISIGIDIVTIRRFEKMKINENKEFYKKIFSDSEINYCINKKNCYESFAGKFAIKEAVIKSINQNIPHNEIITDHLNNIPIVKLLNNHDYEFLVSISHEEHLAVAVVISFMK